MAAKGTVIGNLGRDANTGNAANGNFRAFFNVASTRKWRNKDGEQQETTIWVPCHFWGPRAEAVAPFLLKGKQVAVFGDLEMKADTDRDGNAIERMVLTVQDLQLLGSRTDTNGGTTSDTNGFVDDTANDVPF